MTSPIGSSIHWLDQCESTMDAARALAGAAEGTVVVTRRQTAGRGRHGRTWFSTPGASLTFTVILRPAGQPARFPLLTVGLGVGACLALRDELQLPVAMKWPNDLVDDRGRKLGGILTEATNLAPEDDPLVLVGIGINAMQQLGSDLPPELRGKAASLQMLSSAPLPPSEALLDIVLGGLRHGHERILAREDSALEALWREASADLGKRAVVVSGGETVSGTVVGFSVERGILLRTDQGREVALRGEHISTFRVAGQLYD